MMIAASLCLATASLLWSTPQNDTLPSEPRQIALPPLGAVPNAHQLAWHDKQFYAFVHFGPNTFTGVEWGEGREDPKVFAPTDLDAKQWVAAFKDAGMTGVIITAKHHDGFCLWPSDHTGHDVASSGWLDGQGDVLQRLSVACEEAGLWFGVYLSPWDKHEASYGSGDAYNDHFAAQLAEALTGYGSIDEVWFDGACGEGPNGKRQVYDWERFIGVVREHQPGAVIFSDAGPDVRWCGNERAIGSETNWATLRRDEIELGTSKVDELNVGHEGGTYWVPYECNTSIRPGWFWKEGLDGEVKSLETLVDTWYASVGRGGNFLLNVPPDQRGRLADVDVKQLAGLGRVLGATHARDLLDAAVAKGGAVHSASSVRGGSESMDASALLNPEREVYWAVDDGHDAEGRSLAWVEFRLPDPLTFDEVWLEEPIQLGQRVKAFRIQVAADEDVPDGAQPGALAVHGDAGGTRAGWRDVAAGTTIGARRIVRLEPTTARRIRVSIDASLGTPALSRLSLYLSPPKVTIAPLAAVSVNPVPMRLTSRAGAEIRYTLDGTAVTSSSPLYAGPVRVATTSSVRARAYTGGRASPYAATTTLKILGPEDWRNGLQFVRAPDAGLKASIFEGSWQTLDQMERRDPLGSKDTTTFDIGLVSRREQCALRFDGFVKVPKDGLYTFATVSDDGSRLYLHGERVVENDGLHGMLRSQGQVALRAGYHPIRVEWFNARGAAALEVRWSGPGVGRDQPIPADSLFR